MENLLNQYILFHFAIGVNFYFFGIGLFGLFVKYTIFAILQNTTNGVNFMNKYMKFWPDKKLKTDTIVNNISDLVMALFGWYSAKFLESFYK